MARVAVDVVIKPEILDPQGKAILAALARTGHPGVSSVRQGKHFDLEVDDSRQRRRPRGDRRHAAGQPGDRELDRDRLGRSSPAGRARRTRGCPVTVATAGSASSRSPGTLDDVDAARAVRYSGAEAVPLWHADEDLRGVDAVVVPGGFSYGDYLRAGAIAAQAPGDAVRDRRGARRACRCWASATASRSSARPVCCPAC